MTIEALNQRIHTVPTDYLSKMQVYPKLLQILATLPYKDPAKGFERWSKAVFALYTEKHRRYHTLKHLEHMAQLMYAGHKLGNEVPTYDVMVALLLHDGIYNIDITHARNEYWSSLLAREMTKELHSITHEVITNAIMGTHYPNNDFFMQYGPARILNDLDLAILASDQEDYTQYLIEIKQEFLKVDTLDSKNSGHVSFIKARKDFLQKLADKPKLFHSNLYDKFEDTARTNLANEIHYYDIWLANRHGS